MHKDDVKTFSQDGGIGRHTMSPHTTKRRTTNLKTKNNQNYQNIEMYGSPTTKELKKKHSSRSVGGTEMGSWVEGTLCMEDQAVPHLCVDKPGGTPGE